MDKQEYAKNTLMVLRGHAQELSSIHNAIMNDTAKEGGMPALGDIFKELSDSVGECLRTTEHYDAVDPMPTKVREAMVEVLQLLENVVSAMVLQIEKPKRPTT